ncbi:MAG: PTS sugar transporter subunit IIB [Deltaproteobacteria bacterium]|nr:PTS sugar transporter subunit IIB [Deltaproteobacteria bacterium]
MVMLVRVDDRLLHGQIICSWVPYLKADSLIVCSDEAASDKLLAGIMSECASDGLSVYVDRVDDAVRRMRQAQGNGGRTILVVGALKDAVRVYDAGVVFSSLNIGNVHHEENGRRITQSVIIDDEDEAMIQRLADRGVKIDIRDVPTRQAVEYSPAPDAKGQGLP